MQDFSSEFLAGQAWFGKYPTSDELEIIKEHRFTDIIDLTSPEDNLPTYNTSLTIWKYPIIDKSVPSDIEHFKGFIDHILSIIYNDPTRKFYVHCKGGHGRSGTFAAAIIKRNFLNNPANREVSNDEATKIALELTTNIHQQRIYIKPMYRRMGAPQRPIQRNFVRLLKW
jgi:protein-tyrosine phosphatase